MKNAQVYEQSEAFKRGWIHGLYDCVSDDGARWGITLMNEQEYAAGYSAAVTLRRGSFYR